MCCSRKYPYKYLKLKPPIPLENSIAALYFSFKKWSFETLLWVWIFSGTAQ